MLFGFVASLALIASIAGIIIYIPEYRSENCELVHQYFNIANNMTVEPGCRIGVGYSACTDWNIDASEFFQIYKEKYVPQHIRPQNHREIMSHEEFIETFLDFFKEGASSERIAVNKTIIDDIKQWVTEMDLKHYKDIGGHAPKFAARIKQEK